MADELMDVVDEVSGKPTGQTAMKSEVYKKGLWHLAVHVWAYNSKGEMLFQKRSKTKDMHPGKWDMAVAGHVGAGEVPRLTAIREIKEELGIDVLDNLEEVFISKNCRIDPGNKINNVFYHVFVFRFDGNIKDLTLQKEEVDEVKFFSISDVNEILLVNKNLSCLALYNYSKDLIDFVGKKFIQ